MLGGLTCVSQRNVQETQPIVTCKMTIPAHHRLQSNRVANKGQDFDFLLMRETLVH